MYQGAGFRQLPQMSPTSQVPASSTPGKLSPVCVLEGAEVEDRPGGDIRPIGRDCNPIQIEELGLELGGRLRVMADDGAGHEPWVKGRPSPLVVICDQSSVSAGVPPGTPVIVRSCRFAL